jgi:hypothetical protein
MLPLTNVAHFYEFSEADVGILPWEKSESKFWEGLHAMRHKKLFLNRFTDLSLSRESIHVNSHIFFHSLTKTGLHTSNRWSLLTNLNLVEYYLWTLYGKQINGLHCKVRSNKGGGGGVKSVIEVTVNSKEKRKLWRLLSQLCPRIWSWL